MCLSIVFKRHLHYGTVKRVTALHASHRRRVRSVLVIEFRYVTCLHVGKLSRQEKRGDSISDYILEPDWFKLNGFYGTVKATEVRSYTMKSVRFNSVQHASINPP